VLRETRNSGDEEFRSAAKNALLYRYLEVTGSLALATYDLPFTLYCTAEEER
jgi:hypothetical protein